MILLIFLSVTQFSIFIVLHSFACKKYNRVFKKMAFGLLLLKLFVIRNAMLRILCSGENFAIDITVFIREYGEYSSLYHCNKNKKEKKEKDMWKTE